MMGGRIWVESEIGRGTTVHFTARFGVPEAAEVETPSVRDDSGLPVLVVDDNATNRRILEEMLTQWGFRPTAVDGGPAALEAIARAKDNGEPFALVLLDRQMPGMDGLSLAERLVRAPEPAGAAIMLLASGQRPGDADRCRELGLAACLLKPIKASELRAAIESVVGEASLQGRRPSGRSPASAARAGRPLRILLAEDNLVNQRVAAGLLGRAGHSVEVVTDGREALEALERREFDLVFMDVQMPVMDGLEAAAAIRRREQHAGGHIPIIAMTAHAMDGYRDRCLEAGMDRYIAKPIRSDELERTIEGLVPGAHRAEPEDTVAAEPEPAEPLDQDALLESIDGDRELLAEIATMFIEGCPAALDRMRRAIEANDREGLGRAAHMFKGSLGFFFAKRALEATSELERMADVGDLSRSAQTLNTLEREVALLSPALDAMAKGASR
jgi:CheY-like chemotaxis protein